MLQAIDPESALRVDVFRACGGTMDQAGAVELPCGTVRLISLEDLLARTAPLLFGLVEGAALPSVHAMDYLRLADLVDPAEVELARGNLRKPRHPETFAEADALLRKFIPARQHLLVEGIIRLDRDRTFG